MDKKPMASQPATPPAQNAMAPMEAPAPVTVQRMPDGRHAVMSPEGTVLGMHKSPFSAARQVHEYFGPVVQGDTEPAMEASEAKHIGSKRQAIGKPVMPHPTTKTPRPETAKVPRP